MEHEPPGFEAETAVLDKYLNSGRVRGSHKKFY